MELNSQNPARRMRETVLTSLSDILKTLREIENYCTTPHWTADRRWKIEHAARHLRRRLEKENADASRGA
jgi:hypothetical protein